jgi:hypothetical protein
VVSFNRSQQIMGHTESFVAFFNRPGH